MLGGEFYWDILSLCMVDSSARYIRLFLSVGSSPFLVDCCKINTASVLRNSPFLSIA